MTKDRIQSIKYLFRGNYYYEKQNYCKALLTYNLSICEAEVDTEIASIAYGKRALVYYDLKEFDLCLLNLELAEQHQKNGRIIDYNNIRTMCVTRRDEYERPPDIDPSNFFRLTHPANPKLPCLSGCLELKFNRKYGRHIITTRDLQIGDIVAMSDFSFMFFDKRARLHHCSNCAKSSMKLSLIPCLKCSKVMYCNETCREKDYKKFHQYECCIPRDNPNEQHLDLNALKMLMQILAQFDGNVDEMIKFLESNRKTFSIFDFDMSEPESNPMYEKNMILAALSLTHNMNCSELGKSHCLTASHNFIAKHPKLKALWASPHKKYLDKLLTRLLNVDDVKGLIGCFVEVDMNLKEDGYSAVDAKTDGVTSVNNIFANPVGFVVDPYLGLMNQSCYPNLCSKYVDNKHVWIACRTIKAGSQLFMFRGPGVKYITPVEERQEMMLMHFGFRCDCEGCVNKWPPLHLMKSISGVPRPTKTFADLQLLVALKKILPKEYYQYTKYRTELQALEKHFPCVEYVELEQTWMLNIYRLAQPAKWFYHNESDEPTPTEPMSPCMSEACPGPACKAAIAAAAASTSATAGPSTSASAGPSTSATAGPSTSASAGPSTSASAGPSTSASAGPSTSASAGPSTSASAKPSTSTHAKSSGKTSTAPSDSTSAEPPVSPSTEPSSSEMVEPSASEMEVESSASEIVEPSASVSDEPSSSVTVEPSVSESTEQCSSEMVEPSASAFEELSSSEMAETSFSEVAETSFSEMAETSFSEMEVETPASASAEPSPSVSAEPSASASKAQHQPSTKPAAKESAKSSKHSKSSKSSKSKSKSKK